jgi:hypothetical protein
MKKILVAISLAAFVMSGSMALAAVKCCKDKKCADAKTDADCTKGGGKVVKDCKECK